MISYIYILNIQRALSRTFECIVLRSANTKLVNLFHNTLFMLYAKKRINVGTLPEVDLNEREDT